MYTPPMTATNWKYYTITIAEVWLTFSIATFAMGLYFSYLDSHLLTIIFAIIMSLAYLFIIGACVHRLAKRLPLAALMLIIPIAPLAVLLLVVALLPVIQALH